jgi:hypothetical protein
MPAIYKIKKDCVSLQVHKSKEFPKKNKISSYLIWKRVCLFASQKHKARGSITLEAAIALTIFMMLVFFVSSFMIIINTEVAMQVHIDNVARKTAKIAFYAEAAAEMAEQNQSLQEITDKIFNKLGQTGDEEINENLEKMLDKGYLMVQLVKNTGGNLINSSRFLCDIKGITVEDSSIENGIIDMVVRYKIKVPFVNKYLKVCQRALVKDWTGVDITETTDMVYITETGKVYHTTKDCSHLVIHISKTTFGQVNSQRNSEGEKYYKCQYCVKEDLLSESSIFITEDGNKYHTSLQCQGLTRRIIEIDKNQVGERKPCSACAST